MVNTDKNMTAVKRLLTGSRSQCRASGCDWGCDCCYTASCWLLVAGVVRVLSVLDDLLGPGQQSGEGTEVSRPRRRTNAGGWHNSEFRAPPECVEGRKGDEQNIISAKVNKCPAWIRKGGEIRACHCMISLL